MVAPAHQAWLGGHTGEITMICMFRDAAATCMLLMTTATDHVLKDLKDYGHKTIHAMNCQQHRTTHDSDTVYVRGL